MGSLIMTTAPTEEPMTVSEMQEHLRVDSDDDATYISSLITAARMECEDIQGRATTEREYEYTVPVAASVKLPMPPLLEVDTVHGIDADGVETAVADYTVDTDSGVSTVTIDEIPADSVKIKVTYTAGYATAAEVPETFKQAMRMLVGFWYEHRETAEGASEVREIPFSVTHLLNRNRAHWGV